MRHFLPQFCLQGKIYLCWEFKANEGERSSDFERRSDPGVIQC